ncbi:duf1665 domain-containing protein [Fusarium circinatum]|uniref:Duf1665 domain-containing protein n=1 Tax=Fusarium circinatum TaxID=48490 RepID=A0A8H5U3R1_FUSCI|nr:duf1665 domain-containing protein [Fusarium circinatum]
MLPYPQGPALTSAQEKLLWDNDVVRNLTEEQWKAFGQWVGANDPTPLEAKYWITKENGLDLNVFSLHTLALLVKHAKFAYCGQSSKSLEQSYTEDNLIVRKPGFGLPLDHMPDEKNRFPILFPDNTDDGWNAVVLLIREFCMLKFIDELSDKPRWWEKINDHEIATKWKKEALAINWKSYLQYADFTSAMADAADLYQQTGLIPVYDYSAAVLKSDTIMTPELAKSLQEAIMVLEDIAPKQQDWHPGSDGKVLDLVHPSLWPLTYGRFRILLDRVIGLKDAFTAEGQAVMIRTPTVDGLHGQSFSNFSQRFQWLPCDVLLDPATGSVKIASYINNLHPQEHAHLYPIIETFIKKSLPAWDILYRWEDDFAVQRLQTEEAILDCQAGENVHCGCKPWDRPLGENEDPRHPYEPGGEEYEEDSSWSLSDIDEVSDTSEFCEGSKGKGLSDQDESDKDDSDQNDSDPEHGYFEGSQRRKLDEAWFKSTHRVNVPDANPNAAGYVKITPGDVKTTGFFKDKKQIQVIVKLANIHLTPESPSYDGGSWHTEGQLNEHIVSTALYYYDSENITGCTLSFRTNTEDLSDEISYNQYEHGPIYRTFAIERDGDRQQYIGSVHTKAGRAVFFPNLMQHRVLPFKLVDRMKPGHRKILALFLVDPAIPIISTPNVPPQQKNWWDQHRLHNGESLPDSVNDKASDAEWPMGLDEAKVLRLQLMDERTSIQEQEHSGGSWNFLLLQASTEYRDLNPCGTEALFRETHLAHTLEALRMYEDAALLFLGLVEKHRQANTIQDSRGLNCAQSPQKSLVCRGKTMKVSHSLPPDSIYALFRLDPKMKETRVLELLPGSGEIQYTLRTVSLLQNPFFEAPSYVWGLSATQNKPSIVVEGKRITVKPNLLQALLDPRENEKSRTVWAYAVRINQEDNSEKESQVRLITEVYKQASKE